METGFPVYEDFCVGAAQPHTHLDHNPSNVKEMILKPQEEEVGDFALSFSDSCSRKISIALEFSRLPGACRNQVFFSRAPAFAGETAVKDTCPYVSECVPDRSSVAGVSESGKIWFRFSRLVTKK